MGPYPQPPLKLIEKNNVISFPFLEPNLRALLSAPQGFRKLQSLTHSLHTVSCFSEREGSHACSGLWAQPSQGQPLVAETPGLKAGQPEGLLHPLWKSGNQEYKRRVGPAMSGQKRAGISGNSASPRLAWLLQHNQYPRTSKLQESGPTVIRPAFAFSKCIICLFVVCKSLSPSTLRLSGFAKFHSSATWTKILV